MGFKVPQSPTFWAKVTLEATAEDGRHIEEKIGVKFKRKTRTELVAYADRMRGERVDHNAVRDVIEDWKDVSDDAGPMPYTPENLEKLCEAVPGAALQMLTAFLKSSAGAREGN